MSDSLVSGNIRLYFENVDTRGVHSEGLSQFNEAQNHHKNGNRMWDHDLKMTVVRIGIVPDFERGGLRADIEDGEKLLYARLNLRFHISDPHSRFKCGVWAPCGLGAAITPSPNASDRFRKKITVEHVVGESKGRLSVYVAVIVLNKILLGQEKPPNPWVV